MKEPPFITVFTAVTYVSQTTAPCFCSARDLNSTERHIVARHGEESLHSYIDAEGTGSLAAFIALGEQWRGIVFQVAHALNCPTTSDSELALCLRNQDVDRLLHVKIHKPKYVPAYAPLIDRAVIPDKPLNLMENVQLFGRYDLGLSYRI